MVKAVILSTDVMKCVEGGSGLRLHQTSRQCLCLAVAAIVQWFWRFYKCLSSGSQDNKILSSCNKTVEVENIKHDI